MSAVEPSDIARARREYDERDSDPSASSAYSPLSPRMLCLLQQRERAIIRVLRKAGVKSLSDMRVLEVGCGDGNVLGVFQRLGVPAASLHGIDLSEARVAQARMEHPAFKIVCGSATALPYERDEFDLVCHFTLLSSVFDLAIRREIAEEMNRVARPGGLIVSYDVSAIPFLLRAVRAVTERGKRLLHRASRATSTPPPVPHVEDTAADQGEIRTYGAIVPVSLPDLQGLFPAVTWRRVPANVAMDLGSYRGGWSVIWSDILAMIPGLRMHQMAYAVVPPGEGD